MSFEPELHRIASCTVAKYTLSRNCLVWLTPRSWNNSVEYSKEISRFWIQTGSFTIRSDLCNHCHLYLIRFPRLSDAKDQVLEGGIMKPLCTRTDAFLVFNYLQLSLFVRVAKPKIELFPHITKAIVVELELADGYSFHKVYDQSSFSLKWIVFGLVLS